MFTIYTITNLVNGKVYVGQTGNVYQRWQRHKSSARSGNDKHILYVAMRKYGAENFVFEPLLQVQTQEEADYQEHIWIILLRAHKSQDGYVMSKDGKGNYNVFPEDLEKRSKAFKATMSTKPHGCTRWREDIKTEDILRMHYEEDMSSKRIAKQLGCSVDTVLDRMKWAGSPARSKPNMYRNKPSPVQKILDSEKVKILYLEEKLTPGEIGVIFGCSRKSIFNCLKLSGVVQRSMSESLKTSTRVRNPRGTLGPLPLLQIN